MTAGGPVAVIGRGGWDSTGGPHVEQFTLEGLSVCNALFPINSTVRIKAGGPVAGDILKCQLKGAPRLFDENIAMGNCHCGDND